MIACYLVRSDEQLFSGSVKMFFSSKNDSSPAERSWRACLWLWASYPSSFDFDYVRMLMLVPSLRSKELQQACYRCVMSYTCILLWLVRVKSCEWLSFEMFIFIVTITCNNVFLTSRDIDLGVSRFRSTWGTELKQDCQRKSSDLS